MFDKNYEKINKVFNLQQDQIIERNNDNEDADIPDLEENDNYLSSRCAEYLNSNRKLASGQIDSKKIQLPGIFKPGFKDNIQQRKIRDFEEHGYGLISVLGQGQQISMKSKNKFNEHIQNEGSTRIFLDLQGNQVKSSQPKINDQIADQIAQNNNNIQNMYSNIINQQYMLQQQQYMLQGFNYPQASEENKQLMYQQVYAPIQQINVNQQYNILNVEHLQNQIQSSPIDQLYFNNKANFINPIQNPQNIEFNNQTPIQMQNLNSNAENQIIINQQNVNNKYENQNQNAQANIQQEQELQGPKELIYKNVGNNAINSNEEQKEDQKIQFSLDQQKYNQKSSIKCNSQLSGVMDSKAGSSRESKNKIGYKQNNSSQSSQISQKSGSMRRQQPFHEYKFSIAQQQDLIQEEEEFKQDK